MGKARAKAKGKAKSKAGAKAAAKRQVARRAAKAAAKSSVQDSSSSKTRAPFGKDPCDSIFDMICKRLGSARVQDFKDRVKQLGGLRTMSACTGSNIFVAILTAFCMYLSLPAVNELFSCEQDGKKQRFIDHINTFSMGHSACIFNNIADLGSGRAPCGCHPERQNGCEIPSRNNGSESPLFGLVGFSCKTFSRLFNAAPKDKSRPDYRATILENMEGSSGATFAGLVSYLRTHRPPLLGFENVPELMEAAGGANMLYLTEVLEIMGYVVAARVITSSDFCVPQARRRTYGVVLLVEDTGFSFSHARRLAEGIMQGVVNMKFDPPLCIDMFLLQDSHAYLKKEFARQATARSSEMQPIDTKWRKELVSLCARNAVDYQGLALPPRFENSPSIRCLPSREKMGVAFWMQADPEATSIAVGPSLSRMSRGHGNVLGTIVPGSRVILINRARQMSGLESLFCQAYPRRALESFLESHDGKAEPDVLFQDLAGNAFSGSVVLIVAIMMVLHLTPEQLRRHSSMASTSAPSPSAACSADDILDSIISG